MQWIEEGQFRGVARAPLIAGDRIPAGAAATAELVDENGTVLREDRGQSCRRAAADALLDRAGAEVSIVRANGRDLIGNPGWVGCVRRPGILLQDRIRLGAEVLSDKVVILRLRPADRRLEERASLVARRPDDDRNARIIAAAHGRPKMGWQLGGAIGQQIVRRLRVQDLCDRLFTQAGHQGGRISAAKLVGEFGPLGLGLRRRLAIASAALDDGLTETAARARRTEMRADRPAAGRLAADRYVVWIAAEGCDVPLDPAERRLLVLETEIAAASQRRKREKAERAEPVVERDSHDRVRANDPVLAVLVPTAGDIPAAVNIDVHGKLRVLARSDRAMDVHVQTVFVDHHIGGIERLELRTVAAIVLPPHI